MKNLIMFSLKRRFLNKATILLNILLFVLLGCGFFVDKLVLLINPDLFSPLTVYVDDHLWENKEYFFEDNTFYQIYHYEDHSIKESEYVLYYEDQEWIVESLYTVNAVDMQKITIIIQQYEKNNWMAVSEVNQLDEVQDVLNPIIRSKVLSETLNIDSDKQNMMFVVITSIYFMMLSFSSVIANEVVYEKTSKILELILTSVSAKVHFLSKMFIGWLTITIQTLLTGFFFSLWFLYRQVYDHGHDLLVFFSKLGLIEVEANTFREFFIKLNIGHDIIMLFILGLSFLFLGILFLQMIMVIVSSFVTSIEESSNIQSPCYLILLVIYYFALSINNPYQMSVGIGYYLSFVPFFSMLFMPCRLLLQTVPLYEIIISLTIAFIAILLVIDFGSHIYKLGILDNKRINQKVLKKITDDK